jgi:subtilisin family serine protease
MQRFVVAERRAGLDDSAAAHFAAEQTIKAVSPQLHADMVGAVPESKGRRWLAFVDDPTDGLARLHATNQDPHLIVEPVVPRGHSPILPDKYLNRPRSTQLRAQPRAVVEALLPVTVTGSGKGIPDVNVTLVLDPTAVLNQTTGDNGGCQFNYDRSVQQPASISTSPSSSFWTVVMAPPSDPANLALPPIQLDGPMAWWHQALGEQVYRQNRGQGIRIGVIDTGLGPNACLSHAKALGSLIDGNFDPNGGADVDVHGTAIAGLIASRPQKSGDMAGVAPGADLVAIRVFPADGDANQADVAAAIDRLVDVNKVDLINLSLTGTEPSELEHDAIVYALDKGTLCICAAGNDAGGILYPAAYPETVSVSALGKLGWGPLGSIASQMVPSAGDQIGRDALYLAPFSSRGDALDCCAPGLGMITTFPSKSQELSAWGEDSGTSLSTPLALGILATALAGSAEYTAAPRDRRRSDLARQILASISRTIGISAEYEGRGIPTADE